MKKSKAIISILCTIAIILSLAPMPKLIAKTVGPLEYGDYEYIIHDNPFLEKYISLQRYKGNESEPIIPTEINGIPVKDFSWGSEGTFEDCTSITNIVIPEGIDDIGEYTFSGCTNLKSIYISSSIYSINGYDCFPFFGCKSLESFYVDPNNKYFISEDGVIFDKNKTRIVSYPPGKPGEEYTVPNGIKIIGYLAFSDNDNLRKLILPDGVEGLAEGIIYGCSNLKEMVIPDSVSYIDEILQGPNLTIYGYKYSYAIAKAKARKQLYKYININTPESLKAVNSKGTVKLTWSSSSNATGYEVWRLDKSTGKYQLIATTNSKYRTEVTDKKVIKKKTYCYDIRSFRMVNGKKVLSNHKTTAQVTAK